MRRRTISILSLSLIWLLAGGTAQTQQSPPTEYQLKAAFVFNFARFVEWPKSAFATPTSPLVIGILGDNPFRDDLTKMVGNKSVDTHPVVTREFHSVTEATNCHILFISTSEKKKLPEILQSLKGTSVLTVAEMERFIETGGMINFFPEGTKIRFQINQDTATSAGLKVSSKLMSLSTKPGG
jgi:hypothetical protein